MNLSKIYLKKIKLPKQQMSISLKVYLDKEILWEVLLEQAQACREWKVEWDQECKEHKEAKMVIFNLATKMEVLKVKNQIINKNNFHKKEQKNKYITLNKRCFYKIKEIKIVLRIIIKTTF